MNETGCDRVRDAIPGFVSDRLEEDARENVAAHLGRCAECRAEAELASLLFAARPEAPTELSMRIQAAVASQRVRVRGTGPARPWWGLAAAAIAAVALGIGVTTGQNGSEADLPAYVTGAESAELWLSDDGLIAGAPTLDGLSEEALVQLLEEMTVGGQA